MQGFVFGPKLVFSVVSRTIHAVLPLDNREGTTDEWSRDVSRNVLISSSFLEDNVVCSLKWRGQFSLEAYSPRKPGSRRRLSLNVV